MRGISFIFVFIDALGDLTSLISVVFEPKLEVLGIVIYASELILWSGVMACGGYYNLRPWIEAKLAKRRSSREGGVTIQHMETAAEDLERRDSSSSSVFRTASSAHDLPTTMRLRNMPPAAVQ